MFVSEDGTVTGSIQVDKLDEIKAKTPEAKAQLDALKRDRDAGQAEVAAHAERVAEIHRRQNPELRTDEERAETKKAELESSQRQEREAQRLDAERQKAEQQQAGAASSDDAELQRLRGEAEAAGVTVDNRWGADRLRSETDQAKAAKSQKKG
jgi:outer membrane murein-binding lipoprotein Lpp